MRLPLLFRLPPLFLLCACIVEAPGGVTENERRQATVAEVPVLSLKSGANLGKKVEIVGASVQPGRVRPGEQARITVFFKVLEAIEEDYIVFVHVEDPSGRMERMNLDHRPANGLYPTTQWKPGETVKDEFSFYLPSGASVSQVNVWLGLWEPRGDKRMPLTNPEAVRNDGQNRLLLAQVPVAQ
ncbi:hypothetical protein [Stigmatella aurantiaca]|uniref:Conserved uncharacterized protein n=1 Tax=Stigmatella aurantiaca (strain DW4/3-1) TaxID=378806 RepID=E3FII5_STIAD|nr:hypothetical protein [Stigmatella aurantiaca]ADO74146.1 conserved uncharacterized protein [Stigmatella aurantiaca DW4/3-1]